MYIFQNFSDNALTFRYVRTIHLSHDPDWLAFICRYVYAYVLPEMEATLNIQ